VFKPVGFDVQFVPSYSSVAPVIGPISPPKAKPAVCVPTPAISYLAVFILLPLAQAPAVVASSTFQTPEVELYHISPSIGLLGSAERF
jgi:hypothetical protein